MLLLRSEDAFIGCRDSDNALIMRFTLSKLAHLLVRALQGGKLSLGSSG